MTLNNKLNSTDADLNDCNDLSRIGGIKHYSG